jgi:hypothetical protein
VIRFRADLRLLREPMHFAQLHGLASIPDAWTHTTMGTYPENVMIRLNTPCLSLLALAISSVAVAADKDSGTVKFKTWSSSVAHAFMVRGPDEMQPDKTVLRLYLSSVDIGARIKACKTLSCADAALEDGAMVDYGDSRHLAYAVRLNGGKVQYSGGTDGDAFALTTNTPDHLAGTLHIDDVASGGAVVDARFDLGLANTFTTAR